MKKALIVLLMVCLVAAVSAYPRYPRRHMRARRPEYPFIFTYHCGLIDAGRTGSSERGQEVRTQQDRKITVENPSDELKFLQEREERGKFVRCDEIGVPSEISTACCPIERAPANSRGDRFSKTTAHGFFVKSHKSTAPPDPPCECKMCWVDTMGISLMGQVMNAQAAQGIPYGKPVYIPCRPMRRSMCTHQDESIFSSSFCENNCGALVEDSFAGAERLVCVAHKFGRRV